jgi:hypothetical protein
MEFNLTSKLFIFLLALQVQHIFGMHENDDCEKLSLRLGSLLLKRAENEIRCRESKAFNWNDKPEKFDQLDVQIKCLLNEGADPNFISRPFICPQDTVTSLVKYIGYGGSNVGIVKSLLRFGADPRISCNRGTVLHVTEDIRLIRTILTRSEYWPAKRNWEQDKNCLRTFLLTIARMRKDIALPLDTVKKILSYCPELWFNEKTTASLLPHCDESQYTDVAAVLPYPKIKRALQQIKLSKTQREQLATAITKYRIVEGKKILDEKNGKGKKPIDCVSAQPLVNPCSILLDPALFEKIFNDDIYEIVLKELSTADATA